MHLTMRERRRLERRGLDEEGLDIYAGETRDERWDRARERARFADWDARMGPYAIAMLDQIQAHGEPERLGWMRELLTEAAS